MIALLHASLLSDRCTSGTAVALVSLLVELGVLPHVCYAHWQCDVPCDVQDLLVTTQPSVDRANAVIVVGMPGSCKTGLLLDAIALAIQGTEIQEAAVGSVWALPRLTHETAKIMVHKSGVTHNIGRPTVTNAAAMSTHDWQPAADGVPAKYGTQRSYEAIAGRKLHLLEEVQAWVPQLPQLLLQHKQALKQANRPCGAADLLSNCRLIISCDPQQSPCKMYGITEVDKHGRVSEKQARVVMPWTACFDVLGKPGPSVHWHVFALHGQRRLRGLGYRLLHNPCASVLPCSLCMCGSRTLTWLQATWGALSVYSLRLL